MQSVQVTQESRDRVWGPGAQYWVSYLQCTLCIVQRLPLLQVHSKINSNFSVILVSARTRYGDLRHRLGHRRDIDTNLTQSVFCVDSGLGLSKYLKQFVVIIVPIILCQHL